MGSPGPPPSPCPGGKTSDDLKYGCQSEDAEINAHFDSNIQYLSNPDKPINIKIPRCFGYSPVHLRGLAVILAELALAPRHRRRRRRRLPRRRGGQHRRRRRREGPAAEGLARPPREGAVGHGGQSGRRAVVSCGPARVVVLPLLPVHVGAPRRDGRHDVPRRPLCTQYVL